MKAAAINAHGELDALVLQDMPDPVCAPGEVVVAVRAAALNHLDIWLRKGRPGTSMPMPHILGADAAGIVHAVGEGVDRWEVGDEVIINPGLDCGTCEFCLRGQHSECRDFSIVGMGRPGSFAERVAVPARNVQPRPAHLTWEESAALPLAYLTAWRMLMGRARVQAGETVLIHGIGGGVGLAALQLAHLAGVQVVVTSSSSDKLGRARDLGAAHGIQYSETNVVDEVKRFTAGRGVDVVIDTVGAATWPINLEVLRKGGRAVHCGVTSGANVEANLSAIYWNQLTIMGSTMGSHDEFLALLRAVGAAKLRPVIDSTYPLAEVRDAQGRMESGEQFGKIVLTV